MQSRVKESIILAFAILCLGAFFSQVLVVGFNVQESGFGMSDKAN